MRMVVLDDDETSSGDSSSTLMDSFSRRDKLRVLQIGGYLNDVGENEIDSEVGAIDRSGMDLDICGINQARNPNAHGEKSSDGILGDQAELGHTGCRRGLAEADRPGAVRPGRRGAAGPSGTRAGASGALGAVSRTARPGDPVAGACSSSRAALCDTASRVLAGAGRGDERDVG